MTSNGGASWIDKSVNHPVSAVYFINNQVGFFATEDHLMLKTSDGGSTWSKHYMSMSIRKIQFTDAQTGFAAGTNLYKTTNGGSSTKTTGVDTIVDPWADCKERHKVVLVK